MEIAVTSRGEKIGIAISGSVDQVGAEALKAEIERLDLSQTREVVVDMEGVTYIGSAGVGKLLLLYKNLPARDASVSITNLSGDIYTLLSDMELDTIFSLRQG